ncbi:unnamed protein product [Caenorhabditis sp. 36 PRJEB53466]|nr:unnamed protein product [Caenorhabditis sp. 36 PRJEB53466]
MSVSVQDLKNVPFLPILPLQKPPDERKTLQIPMFTFAKDRGVGQMLFELSALFGLARQLGRVPILNGIKDAKIIDRMREIREHFPKFGEKFEEINVQLTDAFSINFNIRYCCVHETPPKSAELIPQHVLLNGVYFQSFKYFNHYRSEIREFLRPKPQNSIRSEAIIPEEFRGNFLICTHTKQKEVVDAGISKPSDPFFTRAATDFLVKKYQSQENTDITVALLGNGPIWAHDLFYDKLGKSSIFLPPTDVMTPESSPNYTAILTLGLLPADDLAFSRKFCDVILLTAPTSSFGWWLAYLAKENAQVYYRDPAEVKDQIVAEMKEEDYFPESWQKLTSSQVESRKKAKNLDNHVELNK